MRKRPAKDGVGQPRFEIAQPDEGGASDGAGETEGNEPGASGRPPAVGSRKAPRGQWYSVIDKVYALPNLQAAWIRVRAKDGAAGVDQMTVSVFGQGVEERLAALSADLRAKTYRPAPVRRVYIPKSGGGQRPLGIPTVRDRVVQQAILQVLEPLFEPRFSQRSHGFRRGRGCASALAVVDQAVRHGYTWVVDADIRAFFDSVDHETLLTAVHEVVTDGSLLALLRRILTAGVVEPGAAEATPTGVGTPQGGPVSPLLANIYLHALDQRLEAAGYGLVRYADDFVIFARSEAEASAALELAREVLEGELGLYLHPAKTAVVTVAAGFTFLGFHWFYDERQGCWRKEVSRKSASRFRERLRELTPRLRNQTKPREGTLKVARLRRNRRLGAMVAAVNRYLRGWHWYFKGLWSGYPEEPFRVFERRVRARLRLAIVGRPGSGWWHRVLSNRVLAELGLVGLGELQAAWRRGALATPVRQH